ncbi:hypothetical protein [Pinibacter soli]|uniref:Baseplate J-like protein n=1 Tax=Pinibacter soli TaxID=3044211 RepID=A0ABT6RB29_9BACT|nr:hypothetical protein [Pinibacter soli]MDI3319779.1 hypothetical protein [Pinibacter soli]
MPCNDKNPLTREGTSIVNRVLAALSTTFAKVDERNSADLILFAKRYAARLNYYKEDNTIDGDWQSLMGADVSVPLATLTRISVEEVSNYKRRIYKQIVLAGSDADAKTEFKFLFDLVFSVVKMVDQQFQLLPVEFEFKSILLDVITNKLQQPLANIEKNFNDFKAVSLLDYTTLQLDSDSPIVITSEENFSRATDMSSYWQTAVPDIDITLPAVGPAKDIIVYIINHNLFNAQIELLFNGISSVVNRANDLFTQTMEDYPEHTPHFALFIAFIKIYLHAQEELNSYTQRHLDFYYKEVLRLSNKAPETDAAHVLFELQKPVSQDRLVKGTLLKGGKDITGKEISYELLDDIVINKATVAKIYSTQIMRGAKDLLKASPVANSDDGQGAKITSADNSWYTYGDVRKIQNAQTGFAIASNIFYLNEGTRTITITINFSTPIPVLLFLNLNCFTAQFTGKKKWEQLTAFTVNTNAAGSQLIFTMHLTPDDPAVVPYAEKIHAQNMNVELPVLEIYLNQDIANSIPYTLICNREISSINVSVSVNGVKDLMLSNDNGTIDASKPFKPFGDFPATTAGFYVGNKEITQKHLSELDIITSWKSPGGGPSLTGKANYLRQNSFDTDVFSASKNASAISISFSGSNGAFTPAVIDFTKNEKITATTLEGFFKVSLNENTYSLAQHLANVSAAISGGTSLVWDSSSSSYKIKVATTPVPTEVILNSVSVNYTAFSTIVFDAIASADNDLFFHLGSFGFARVNNALVDASAETEKTEPITLLQDIANEGELFVGLENANADTVVTLLFQVAEGSSNPLLDMEQLGWYYLADNNNWKVFKKENIIDTTNNFTQSGVVTLTLPKDCSTHNTLLENGLAWIKITAHPFTDAVCKMVLIQAQAAKVQLVQNDTTGIEFRQLLPAGTISKLVNSDGSFKKIAQPFDSFDGRVRETDEHFYVRVSERLRHKQRGITIWDYEHIVLEKFEKIFKVKCINHAGFYSEKGVDVFCENYAGHVSVITVPNQRNNTNVNPLRPYTPIGLLNNINDYLKTIISPFVKLHVKNPQFEEIQLDFKVTFYEHMDPAFYMGLLNDEIEKFLCPWAFDDDVEVSFGGKIYKSELINFIEERPYVDFVTCVKMYQFINRTDPPVDVEVAVGSTARSILVSYYDEVNNIKHKIVSPAICTC